MAFKYIGNGTFLLGTPARDLTDKEAEVYGEQRLLASGLYVRVTETGKPRPSSTKVSKPASSKIEESSNDDGRD